jgi:hypothetical protein
MPAVDLTILVYRGYPHHALVPHLNVIVQVVVDGNSQEDVAVPYDVDRA